MREKAKGLDLQPERTTFIFTFNFKLNYIFVLHLDFILSEMKVSGQIFYITVYQMC